LDLSKKGNAGLVEEYRRQPYSLVTEYVGVKNTTNYSLSSLLDTSDQELQKTFTNLESSKSHSQYSLFTLYLETVCSAVEVYKRIPSKIF